MDFEEKQHFTFWAFSVTIFVGKQRETFVENR